MEIDQIIPQSEQQQEIQQQEPQAKEQNSILISPKKKSDSPLKDNLKRTQSISVKQTNTHEQT